MFLNLFLFVTSCWNLAFALSNYLCGACSFTPDRKTKATALSVHIVRVVLDSIAGHKPIFIVLLFQRESSFNAFQLLRSLSCSFILAPLRWLNVLLPSGRRLLAYHIGCLNCRIPHVFGCFMLRDVCWLHTPVKIYQRVIFSSRSRLRRVLLLFVVYSLFAICMANICFLFQLRWTYPISLDQTWSKVVAFIAQTYSCVGVLALTPSIHVFRQRNNPAFAHAVHGGLIS